VSPQERTRASDVDKKTELSFPKKTRQEPVEEFKLIDSDDRPHLHDRVRLPPSRPHRPGMAGPFRASQNGTTCRHAAARRVPKANANGRVRARDARSPQTLEETLEILGAGELEMDTALARR